MKVTLTQTVRTSLIRNISQRGSVLPISLFILLVLTIIGATSLNETVMEEKMSSNFQGGNLAYQAAESSINRTYINVSASTTLARQAIAAWVPNPTPGIPINWPTDGQLQTGTGNGNISTTLTARVEANPSNIVNSQGCTISIGMPTKCKAIVLDVVATGQVTGTNIQRTHTQGVKKPLPPG